MSRFYQTLEEASRPPYANGTPLAQNWTGERPAPPPQEPVGKGPAAEVAVMEPATPSPAQPEEAAPRVAVAASDRLLIREDVDAIAAEQYRRLRTKLLQMNAAQPFRSIVVTSPTPRDGKTLTVLNLGLTFGLLPGFSVLVIDGDLRRGGLGTSLGIDDCPGFSNYIEGSASLDDVVLNWEGTSVQAMPRGTSKLSPGELLQSGELQKRLRRIAERYSLVIVDSPPVNLISDVQLLAAGCDGVLLVGRAFTTTRKAFQKASQDLASFRMLGTVMNGGTRSHLSRRYRSYY